MNTRQNAGTRSLIRESISNLILCSFEVKYNEFNQYGDFMENPVAPWFENGDDDNGGPDAFTHFIG